MVRARVVTMLKPRTEVAGGLHRRLGNADDRSGRDLASGVEARISETGDHIAVDAFSLAPLNCLQHARHRQRLVVVAFDRLRPDLGGDAGDDHVWPDHRRSAFRDRVGHGLGGVGIDHPDPDHGSGATASLVRVAST